MGVKKEVWRIVWSADSDCLPCECISRVVYSVGSGVKRIRLLCHLENIWIRIPHMRINVFFFIALAMWMDDHMYKQVLRQCNGVAYSVPFGHVPASPHPPINHGLVLLNFIHLMRLVSPSPPPPPPPLSWTCAVQLFLGVPSVECCWIYPNITTNPFIHVLFRPHISLIIIQRIIACWLKEGR